MRTVHIREVTGSNPVSPTDLRQRHGIRHTRSAPPPDVSLANWQRDRGASKGDNAPVNRLLRDPQFLARVAAMILGIGWVGFDPTTVTLAFVPPATLTLGASTVLVGSRSRRQGPLRAEDLPAIVVLLDLATGALWMAADSSVVTSIAFIAIIVAGIGAIGRLGGRGAVATMTAWIAGRAVTEMMHRLDGRPTDTVFLIGEGVLVLAATVALWVTFAAFRSERVRTQVLLDQLEREVAMRRDYVSLMAHELRNPLAGIKAAATVLARKEADPAASTAASNIALEASAGLALLDDLAEVSSVESGRLRTALVRIDLDAVVRATVATFDQAHPVDVRGAGSPLYALGDERRIAQVVRNLVNNAVKYSQAGSPVEISVGLSADRLAASVSVRDHGPGVPPAERPRLFEKFRRLSTAGATRGSGLGLYISRQIARDHGGELTADWPPGGGSVFTFSLPLAGGAGTARGAGTAQRGP